MDEKLILKIHISFALLGLFGGVFGFIVFVFGFYNYHAGKFFEKNHIVTANWTSLKPDRLCWDDIWKFRNLV